MVPQDRDAGEWSVDMPWTSQQVKYLLSKGSPLSAGEKDKMKSELHADPSLGHKKKKRVLHNAAKAVKK